MVDIAEIGPYVLEERLDTNGPVRAYRARDGSGRLVALRCFPAEEDSMRFMNDASWQLDHPHIARIVDVGREDGMRYIAREFVDGCDLRDIQRGPDEPVKLALLLSALYQVREAHSFLDGYEEPRAGMRGVEHGSLRAQNVLVGCDGQVKLTNFDRARPRRTPERVAEGTVLLVVQPSDKPPSPYIEDAVTLRQMLDESLSSFDALWPEPLAALVPERREVLTIDGLFRREGLMPAVRDFMRQEAAQVEAYIRRVARGGASEEAGRENRCW